MSAFETGTSFFNPRNLSENHYLTWGYSDLDYLANYPFITARISAGSGSGSGTGTGSGS